MQTLTRKEEQIMQAVWQIGHPCLISEILKKRCNIEKKYCCTRYYHTDKKKDIWK